MSRLASRFNSYVQQTYLSWKIRLTQTLACTVFLVESYPNPALLHRSLTTVPARRYPILAFTCTGISTRSTANYYADCALSIRGHFKFAFSYIVPHCFLHLPHVRCYLGLEEVEHQVSVNNIVYHITVCTMARAVLTGRSIKSGN